MKKIVLAVAVLLSLTACTKKSEQMKELAQMSLRQSLGGGQLKIMSQTPRLAPTICGLMRRKPSSLT